MVDGENPKRLARARLRALGMPSGSGDRLRYFSRAGIAIGDEGYSDAWLSDQLANFRPDLLVIDTLMAACDLEDTNSNAEAVAMMKRLRARAEEFNCAVLLLHHERKQSKDHPRSPGQAIMGARQWAGQADAHMTLTVESASSKRKWTTAPSRRGGRSSGDRLRRTATVRSTDRGGSR